MSLDYDPVSVLETVGYTEREATFLYLVAVHSGYFLRRQYDRFIQRGRGAIAAQLLRKAFARGHLQTIVCGQARFVYHLTAKQVYDAIGQPASQHRRLKGDGQIKSRLMVLDFVLDHLGDRLLDSAGAKTEFFARTLGLTETPMSDAVARSAYRFPEAFPILIDGEQFVRFTFVDEDALSLSSFEAFLRRYGAVFAALPGFELLYLAVSNANFERASKALSVLYPEVQTPGITPMTPRGVDHLLEYLRARESHDAQKHPLTPRDLAVLHEGERIYTTLEHRALCAAWQVGSTNAERIRQRFKQQGPRAKFTPVLMPYSYPLHQFRRERMPQPELRSSVRSSALPLFEKKLAQKRRLSQEGACEKVGARGGSDPGT